MYSFLLYQNITINKNNFQTIKEDDESKNYPI